MAVVHAAVYDAVNAIDQTHEPYAVARDGPRDASPEAAAAAAAHRTLVELFPAQQAAFDAELVASLADVPDGSAENKGVALGRSVAQCLLAMRRHDGADRETPYTPGTDPGDWQPTPPGFLDAVLPQWPDVTPFTMTSGSQFRAPAPPALTSAEYAAAFDEVKALGAADSAVRTAEQTEIALFWVNGPGTATPAGHWNEVAQTVAEAEGNTLTENARLFALLNLALADAGIVSWDSKYEFDFWRPVTAIRAAEADGNPATTADPDWTPLIPTPAFPAYTSGHSTFSAAAAAVLADFFGTDAIAFTLESETPDAGDRSFESFSEAAAESGLSRIYGGIHWSFDNVQGLETGEALGHFVTENYLRPREAACA
jgi:membrane-associated phospholipid phosphatase